MNVVVVTLCGAGAGLGLLVVAAGLRGRQVVHLPVEAVRARVDGLLVRGGLALAAAVVVGGLTGWPVAAAVAALTAAAVPTMRATAGRHRRELARIEAIATWVEQLRDTLSAANGLEHALAASARLAPAPIAAEVERLAARSEYEPLPTSLRRFAGELDHPLADFVVAALVVATEHEARDLAALLGSLAASARDEARLRERVWASRARTRTSVRVIGGVLVAVVGLLLVFDRDYLRPYDSAGGQAVLLVIAGIFAASLWAMGRLGRIELPERFVGHASSAAGSGR